jgi:hypothetical protein
MAVLTLCSASGSPGVTTTAVAMAMNWPRPVLLLDADPTGGSSILAGFLRGTREYDAGLIELALSPLGVPEALREVVRPLLPGSAPNVSFVAGLRSHAQVGALRDLWEPLSAALADLDTSGQDVIVDAGRLGLAGSPLPLLERADLSLLLTRTNLPALSAARTWADTVRRPGSGWGHAGALIVGSGKPYAEHEIVKVLGLPVFADLPDDPEAAAVYHRGAPPPRHFETGAYLRAIAAEIASVQAQLARSRLALVEEAR